MKYEKSCGAVIFRENGGEKQYLLVLNKKSGAKGHWGFPKGHTEPGETEYQTAAREIFEETALRVVFHGNARVVSTYSPREDITKDAVYFLATPRDDKITLQKSELAEYRWCSSAQVRSILTYDEKIFVQLEKML